MPASFDQAEYIKKTNLSDDQMTLFSLSKQGYGSITELEQLDTPEFFDLIEFEQITGAIERYEINKASKP